MTARHLTHGFHRQDTSCRRSHMTNHDQFCLRSDRRFDGSHCPFVIWWKRQDCGRYLRTGIATLRLPDILDSSVFVIGQQYFVVSLQNHAGGDDIHGERGIVEQNKSIGLSSKKSPQHLRGTIQFFFHVSTEELHRLTLQPLTPARASFLDRNRRRAKRSMIEINTIRIQLPEFPKRMHRRHEQDLHHQRRTIDLNSLSGAGKDLLKLPECFLFSR